MVITKKRHFGNAGEKAAADYLKNKGYKIIEANFENKLGRKIGEIDIIAQEKDEMVFVEVKTRNIEHYSETLPEENITYSKLKKMARTGEFYLRKNHLENSPYRFDAVSVWLNESQKTAKIKHISHL